MLQPETNKCIVVHLGILRVHGRVQAPTLAILSLQPIELREEIGDADGDDRMCTYSVRDEAVICGKVQGIQSVAVRVGKLRALWVGALCPEGYVRLAFVLYWLDIESYKVGFVRILRLSVID